MLRYELRPATSDDVSFLADVVVAATRSQGRLPDDFDEPQWRDAFSEWTMEQVRGDAAESGISVIEVDGQRVGRLRVTRSAGNIELCGIQLLPDVQRRGIGTAVINDLKAEAAGLGIPLDLSVEKDNQQARKLYDRLGFVAVGETEDEYKLRWNPRPGT